MPSAIVNAPGRARTRKSRSTLQNLVAVGLDGNSAVRPIPQDSRWQVLTATWLGEMFGGMDASIYVLVMHQCLSELIGASAHSVVAPVGALVLAIFIIGWVIGGISCGILADYFGRSRIMLCTILLYALASGLCAFSHNWQELAFYRFLVGFGIGGEIGIGAVMVAETFKTKSRMHAASFLASSFACGYLLAAVANYYIGHLGWRYLFLLGVLPALVTVYFRTKLKEPEHFEEVKREKRIAKMVARASGNRLKAEGFTLPQVFSPKNLHSTLVAMGLSTAAIVGYWAVLAWLPAWVTQLVGGTAVHERSLAAVTMNIGGLSGSLIAGFLVSKLGRARSFRLANLMTFGSCLLLFGTVKHYGNELLILVFCMGFFAQMLFALLFIYVPELYEAKIRCTGVTTSITCGRILSAAAAVLGGQLIALLNGSYAGAALLVSSVYLLGAAVSFFMPGHADQTTL